MTSLFVQDQVDILQATYELHDIIIGLGPL
jgi:hypothetical protein